MALIESSVHLAKKLDMQMVTEGVETAEEWNLASDTGCHYIQGHYIAKPMPADKLSAWIEEWSSIQSSISLN